jgi:hypothetical protein
MRCPSCLRPPSTPASLSSVTWSPNRVGWHQGDRDFRTRGRRAQEPPRLRTPGLSATLSRTPVLVNTRLRLGGFRRATFAVPLAIMAMWLAVSCASQRTASRTETASDPYLVVAGELESSVRANLYDALFELRPRWFTRTNSADPFVYVDDQMLGTTGALRRFAPHQVTEARYLSPTEAQVQYGQRNLGRAAIVLRFDRD